MFGSILSIFVWCLFINNEVYSYIGSFFTGFGLYGFIPVGISIAVKYKKNVK